MSLPGPAEILKRSGHRADNRLDWRAIKVN